MIILRDMWLVLADDSNRPLTLDMGCQYIVNDPIFTKIQYTVLIYLTSSYLCELHRTWHIKWLKCIICL